jgi:hypothetical protein
MEPAGQPRSASRELTFALAPGSSPERKTLLGPMAAGSVIIVIAAVFIRAAAQIHRH